jgi:hypothetical protein
MRPIIMMQQQHRHNNINESWAQVRRSWVTGAFRPWERAGAVVAAGQLMRLGLEATGADHALYDSIMAKQQPHAVVVDEKRQPQPDDDHHDDGGARMFFMVDERKAQLDPNREAISELVRQFANK